MGADPCVGGGRAAAIIGASAMGRRLKCFMNVGPGASGKVLETAPGAC